jgi:ribonucleoside-triphosphate reductase
VILKVIKRDGRDVKFNPAKIKSAICKAFDECNEVPDDSIISNIIKKVEDKLKDSKLSVEDIQDMIVVDLINSYKDVGMAYQSYRALRADDRVRNYEAVFERMESITVEGDDENSNKNYTLPSVIRDTIAGEYFRNTLDKRVPKKVYQAHKNMDIWYHDSDFDNKFTNCCLVNLEDTLENGTKITNADINPPKSIQTAMNIANQIVASVSSVQYGGVSLSNFNEILAKYAKMNFVKNFKDYFEFLYEKTYDDNLIISSDNEELKNKYNKVFTKTLNKTDKDIYDACQLYEYQTNSVLGNSSQTPFSTITFNIPTSWESERIILNYLDVRMKGLGSKGIIALFPKISMIVVDGYNLKEGDKYYYILEKASECIAKTYYPDILNYSKEDYDNGKYYGRMGCRSRVNHEFKDKNGNYMQSSRFNYGVQTLNVPRLALETIKRNEDINYFFKLIESKKDIMKLAIKSRFNRVKNLKAKEAPILFQHGAISRLNPEDKIEELLKTTQASVSYGYFGIDDCVRLLTNNEHNISTEYGLELGLKIIQILKQQVDEIAEETGLPVSLYATPIEASIHTFYIKDLELYGKYMPEWLKNRKYYTNSFHFSSELPIDAFSKIDIESKFIPFNNGGNISYSENSGKVSNTKAIVELIQYAYDKKVEYYAMNTISDVCYDCGYIGEIEYNEDNKNYKCPNCNNSNGANMKIQRRSCGYISNYNITHGKKGRMLEIKNRAKHF